MVFVHLCFKIYFIHFYIVKINLNTDEVEGWKKITSKINLVIKDDIISQYDGYFDLQELDWDFYTGSDMDGSPPKQDTETPFGACPA